MTTDGTAGDSHGAAGGGWPAAVEAMTGLASASARSLITLAEQSLKALDSDTLGDEAVPARVARLVRGAYAPLVAHLRPFAAIGPGREAGELLVRAADAWVDAAAGAVEYQLTVLGVSADTNAAFASEFARRAGRDAAPNSLRELADLYLDVAERVFNEAFRSDAYVRAQSRAVNAALAYRARERALADLVLGLGHVPSRTEVDEAYRQIHELRRTVRALRQALAEVQQRDIEPAPTGALAQG